MDQPTHIAAVDDQIDDTADDHQQHPHWLRTMLSDSSYQPIMNASDLVLGKTPLTPDHLFTALLRHHLLRDMICLYHAPTAAVLNAYHLGSDTCGHPGIIHGGLTSSVIDDSFGILVYMLKGAGKVDKGPAFTANLQIWLRAEVRDGPQGTVFAEAKALFVNARKGTVDFEHMAPSIMGT